MPFAMPKPTSGNRRWLPAVVFLTYCLTRWVAFPAGVTETDEVLFCQAVERYDLARHHPHPPGYPLYVALGKLAAHFVQPNFEALAWVGLLCSCSAIWPACRLVTGLTGCDRTTTWAAAAVFAHSPVVWLTSAQAFSDVPALAASMWTVWLLWKARVSPLRRPKRRYLAAATLLATAAIGLRPQVAVSLVPLIVLVVAERQIGWRRRLLVTALGILGCAAWFAPMVWISGGWRAYLDIIADQGRWYWQIDTVFGMVHTDWTRRFSFWLRPWGAAATAIPIVALAGMGFACLLRGRPTSGAFVATWFLPYFLFILCLHSPETPRYALPALPPIIACLAAALAVRPRLGRWVGVALAAGLAVQAAPVVWLLHRQQIPPLQAAAWLRVHADPGTDLIVVDERLETLMHDALRGMNWVAAKAVGDEEMRGGHAWLLTEFPKAGATPVFERSWKSRRLVLFTRHRFLSAHVYRLGGSTPQANRVPKKA